MSDCAHRFTCHKRKNSDSCTTVNIFDNINGIQEAVTGHVPLLAITWMAALSTRATWPLLWRMHFTGDANAGRKIVGLCH